MTMSASNSVRRRLEAQGFNGLDDAAIEEVGPWLRWSPAPDRYPIKVPSADLPAVSRRSGWLPLAGRCTQEPSCWGMRLESR